MNIRPALAQPDTQTSIEGAAVETEETEMIRQAEKILREDVSARERLARRIMKSSLAAHLTVSEDSEQAAGEADDWILKHPEEAAQLAVGFARDDHDGTHAFEQSLYARVSRYFELNPKRYRGILGTLTAAGRESKRISFPQKLSEEEQREILKNVFEGEGGETTKVLRESESSSHHAGDTAHPSGPATFAGTGLYDRLSALNPSGYSPNVLAYQSALNAERIPGAPRLLENGRLDYPTLLHPFYALRFDIEQLAAQLRSYRTWTLAKNGQTEGTAKDRALPPSFVRRQEALDRAAGALLQLRTQAEKAKNPAQLNTGLLRVIGTKQKEAARWITIASIEADLQQLEDQEGFWNDEFKAVIRAAPAAEEMRNSYLNQGEKLKARLTRIEEYDRRTLSCLENPEYLSCWPEAQRLLAAAGPLRKDLRGDIGVFAVTPSRLSASRTRKSAWRDLIDRCVKLLFPNSDYARRLSQNESDGAAALEVFGKIASGDFSAAETPAASFRPR